MDGDYLCDIFINISVQNDPCAMLTKTCMAGGPQDQHWRKPAIKNRADKQNRN